MNGIFFLSQIAPLVYANIPKSGCTTVKNVLHRLETGDFLGEPNQIHAGGKLFSGTSTLMQEVRPRIFFTFVRHPLERAYSCFNDKFVSKGDLPFARARAIFEREYGAKLDAIASLTEHRAGFKLFLTFIDDCMRRPGGIHRRNPHWCSQSFILRHDVLPYRMLDFIGRVEHFDRDMTVLLDMVGKRRDFQVPRMNENRWCKYPYSAILDEETIKLARSVFAPDLKNFGYSL